MEKPVAGSLSVMFKCSWEMLFFESNDKEIFKADRNKLFACNMTSKLTIIPRCLTCFTQTCQLCVPSIVDMSL